MEPKDIPICGESFAEYLKACNEVLPNVEMELRKRFIAIRSEYMGSLGLDRGFARIQGRTIAEVVLEYVETGVTPLREGQREGLKYVLYDVPPNDQDL